MEHSRGSVGSYTNLCVDLEPKPVTKNLLTSIDPRKIARNLMALFWMRFIQA
jgi:hypothetical protein